tara:strand:- start:1301 stop:1678 length:378 start_codon:yes stop_codon:yes gene_type:complete
MFDLIKKNNLIDNIFDSYISNSSGLFNIYANDSHVSYDEKSYNIEIAIPGADKKDIKLTVKNDVLFIDYSSEASNSAFRNSFSREICLPNDIDEENINAELKNGILSIKILRNVELSKSKEIIIK